VKGTAKRSATRDGGFRHHLGKRGGAREQKRQADSQQGVALNSAPIPNTDLSLSPS